MTMRRRVVSRGAKMRTSWEQRIFSFVLAAAGTQSVADLTPEPMRTSNFGTSTIRRMILHATLLNDAAASTTAINSAIGVSVITADAFGAAAVPDPLDDVNQDFYYWAHRTFMDRSGNSQFDWDADIRSMRRLRAGYKLVLIVHSPVNEVASQLDVSVRTLWSSSA